MAKKAAFLLLMLIVLAGCGSSKNASYTTFEKKAVATYYADKFNGKQTASGEKFSNSKLTAAHKKLPFGTKLKVTNNANGKSVIVTVNDRGPFTKGYDIDLSKKAFMEISDNKNQGKLTVTLEIAK
ncbi:septal ring lytic transglycosylase RlpA family protein [Flavobacterium psychrotrophum]|uniref:septal ring lytic transglycosylase RlpA family protein n=1 Tax=Flavobacterium psychrotrophum TaxID=2294119 RepID=UPI000E30CEBC|nr:septal ring lytic transglycosylase RlpA family protein [Flavobacterium psychrotrophum]